MSVAIKDLNDQQLLESYDSYWKSESSNWRLGLGLLLEISSRFGERINRDVYLAGLRRIIAIKPLLKGREEHYFPPNFVIPLPEIKCVIEEMTKDICLAVDDTSFQKFYDTMRYDVPVIRSLEQYDEQVDAVLGRAKGLFGAVDASRRFLAFGSCFAVNMGRFLRERGYSAYTLIIAEDVNSSFNNLELLKRVFLGEKTSIAEELQVISGFNADAVREEFARATDILFTLGNVYHLERDGVSTLLGQDAEVIAESLEETISCLRAIFRLLRDHTQATVYVSVSPIPIRGYRGEEFGSAMEADCASKSQLRAALASCLREFTNLHYVPTFEIFRWLPAHQSFATFGADDGNARHLDGRLLTRVLNKIAG